jgi:predicted Na+-dependent transporter
MSRRRVSVRAIAEILDHWLLAFVLLAAATGLAAPGPGRLVDVHNAIPVVLAVLVLTAGASVKTAGLRRLHGAIVPITVIVAGSTVALPGLAWPG